MVEPSVIIAAVGAVAILSAVIIGRLTRRDQTSSATDRRGGGHDRRARGLLDALPDAVMHVDLTGLVLVANHAAANLFGASSSSDLTGTTVDDHLVDADRGVLADWITRTPVVDDIDDPEHHVAFEARALRIDGDTRDVEITVHRTGSADAPVLLRVHDRSRRDDHRRALDQARHRFHQAFQSAPTGMALVRLDDGRIVDANQSLADMLLRTTEELVGRTLRELTHPDDVRAAQSHRAQLELGIVQIRICDVETSKTLKS